ncbi:MULTISPECIES: hypothetical protein [unclassified Brenneria]|uniref:hypothetical protein n=1 Tax=unclassified Brenneria TaxID=2634434 RepID=UPI0015542C58|nr:hypothetical protein [Brenneria sp. hezel4-2-4]
MNRFSEHGKPFLIRRRLIGYNNANWLQIDGLSSASRHIRLTTGREPAASAIPRIPFGHARETGRG